MPAHFYASATFRDDEVDEVLDSFVSVRESSRAVDDDSDNNALRQESQWQDPTESNPKRRPRRQRRR